MMDLSNDGHFAPETKVQNLKAQDTKVMETFEAFKHHCWLERQIVPRGLLSWPLRKACLVKKQRWAR